MPEREINFPSAASSTVGHTAPNPGAEHPANDNERETVLPFGPAERAQAAEYLRIVASEVEQGARLRRIADASRLRGIAYALESAEQPEGATPPHLRDDNEACGECGIPWGNHQAKGVFHHSFRPNVQSEVSVTDAMVERAIQTFHRKTGAPCVSTIDEFRAFRAALEDALGATEQALSPTQIPCLARGDDGETCYGTIVYEPGEPEVGALGSVHCNRCGALYDISASAGGDATP